MFHNKLLEKLIKSQMEVCSNEGCSKYLFKWAIEEHELECPFKQSKCEICKEFVSFKSVNRHLKTNCSVEWLEDSVENLGGSLGLAEFYN